MEGISHEACSLAGTLKLSRLIVFYDDNGISIDGHVENWFADNTPERFAAYGWNVIPGVDGHATAAIAAAIVKAKQFPADSGGPTMICCRTIICKGAPNQAGSDKVPGPPPGQVEIAPAHTAPA